MAARIPKAEDKLRGLMLKETPFFHPIGNQFLQHGANRCNIPPGTISGAVARVHWAMEGILPMFRLDVKMYLINLEGCCSTIELHPHSTVRPTQTALVCAPRRHACLTGFAC